MVALNFKRRFADAVRDGTKIQTVRREGKRKPIVTGTQLQLYTGMRTRGCVKLRDAVCSGTSAISMTETSGFFLGGRWLESDEIEAFAKKDGFVDAASMFDFFNPPYDGWVIRWRA